MTTLVTVLLVALYLCCGLFSAWWSYRWCTQPGMPLFTAFDWVVHALFVVVWPLMWIAASGARPSGFFKAPAK